MATVMQHVMYKGSVSDDEVDRAKVREMIAKQQRAMLRLSSEFLMKNNRKSC